MPGVVLLAAVVILVDGYHPVSSDSAVPTLFSQRQTFVGSWWYNIRFGESVAFVGDDVLIGSPFATTELFNASTGQLLQTFIDPESPRLTDGFGEAIASLAGNIVIGAPLKYVSRGRGGGEAYLFDRNGTLLHTFMNPAYSGRFSEYFGKSIAALGENILIGAPRSDTAEEDAGAAYLFNTTGALLRTFLDPSPASKGEFGFAVASFRGNALIGAPLDTNDTSGGGGTVYLFDRSTGDLLHTFSNPTPADGDGFGSSLAVYETKVLIGAPGDDTAGRDAGAAYLFDGGSGTLLKTFTNPNPEYEFIRDEFGSSVAFVSGHILVGAPWEGKEEIEGAVYLFDRQTGALRDVLSNPKPGLHVFGAALATQGNRMLVGAPGRGGPDGAAYLYTIAGIILAEQGGATEVVEGGSVDSYELVLLTQPRAEVSISLLPSDQVNVTPNTLSFTPTDWYKVKTVKVAAFDDELVEGNHTAAIGHNVSSADIAYDGMIVANVIVTIFDNDVFIEPARVGQGTVTILLAAVVSLWATAFLVSWRTRHRRRT